MDWIVWIRGSLSSALGWCDAHPGIANWLQAIGSIAAIILIYLFAVFQFRRTRSHEEIDRIRKAQGLALALCPVLIAFRLRLEGALTQETKLEPRAELTPFLDQIYILGLAGGSILQMVAALQAHQRAELIEGKSSASKSIDRQRLSDALQFCDHAIDGLAKLTRMRTA